MSTELLDVPARLRHVHPLLLADARQRCAGEWSRVVEVDNGLLIQNRPADRASARRSSATAPALAPPVERTRTSRATSKQRASQPEQPAWTRTATSSKLVPASVPAVERPHPRPELEVRGAAGRPARSAPVYDQPLPDGFDIDAAWSELDATRVASSILERCRHGLPEQLPLDLHADVLGLHGIDLDIVATSVRQPSHVEIAGKDTKEKGYPVLRFSRGDVLTVVGMRDLRVPMVIATYATSQLDADQHRSGTTKGTRNGGGGGSRKASGLPTTPRAVVRRLRAMGADVVLDELSQAPTSVSFRGQELGKIAVKATRAQCESDYQRILRRMEAISRRSQ